MASNRQVNVAAPLAEFIGKKKKKQETVSRTVRTRAEFADKQNNCVGQECKLEMNGKFLRKKNIDIWCYGQSRNAARA